jgi:ribosomal protein S18 acetylase RimI-like enzyme
MTPATQDNPKVRPATAADVPALVTLVENYWRFEAIEGFDAMRVAGLLERVIADPALGRTWLASVDGEPAGYLLAVYVFSLEHQGLTAEIDELFVAPHFRGHGLGKMLLAAGEETFRAAGCTNVSLQIGRDNAAARAFYRGNGYEDRAGFELVDKSL